MATSIFEKNGQRIEVPTEALGKAMSDVSGGYVTGQTEQQRLESQGYKLLSPYSGEKIADGSAEIRTDLNVMNNNLNNLPDTGGYDFNQTNYLNDNQKSQLDAITNFSMTLTPQDEADIAAAGMAAGMKYDPLISEAKEEKRKGMPKAVISAGERGGFMSTQMAGVSALAQTEGGDWIGAGGELENIKSVYDVNIQNLETAKLRAIEKAKAAAQAAKLSGKREDRKAMMEAFEFAQNASLKQIQLANEKVQAISNWEKLQTQRIATRMPSLYESITGDPTTDKANIENFAKQYGYDSDLVKNTLLSYDKDIKENALNTIAKKISIAKTIPKGETFTDPESGLTIIGTEDPEVMEVNQVVGNNEYLVRYDLSDPQNPKEMFRINLGAKWKPEGSPSGIGTKMFEGLSAAEGLLQAAKVLQGLKDKDMFNNVTYNNVIDTYLDTFSVYDPTPEDKDAVMKQVNTYLWGFENANKKEEEYRVAQTEEKPFDVKGNLETYWEEQASNNKRNIFERALGTDFVKPTRTATTSIGGSSFNSFIQNSNDLSNLSITK